MYMKRLLFLMIGALLLISCSEDEKPTSNFIEGTKWRATKLGSEYTNDGINFNYKESHRLEFTNTTFTLTEEKAYDRQPITGIYEPEESRTVNGTYKFEYPETTLQQDDGKVIKIKIGTYQLETIPEGGESSRIFTKIQE
jgi:hypothetical protein